MKTIRFIALLTLLFSCSQTKTSDQNQTYDTAAKAVAPKDEDFKTIEAQTESDTLKGSLKAKAMGIIGNTTITINYYSPAVRGRIVWGGLVPFDKVWVTGAHSATNIDFTQEVSIGGLIVPAGKYALFTIPGKEEWIIIINRNWEQHLTDKYDAKDDVVRVKVKPEVETSRQERLRYVIESEGSSEGEVVIYWDTLEISLPVAALKK
ncbi:hypothetical protein BH10BAC4_BH10BAC4_24400 [soil metagenome]